MRPYSKVTNSCLNTTDRHQKRWPQINLSPSWCCCLCQANYESIHHLFFNRPFSKRIWFEFFTAFIGLWFSRMILSVYYTLIYLSKLLKNVYGIAFYLQFCGRFGMREMQQSSRKKSKTSKDIIDSTIFNAFFFFCVKIYRL